MKPTHKGIAFNAVDAANNLNGTKTRHLIRVSGKTIDRLHLWWEVEGSMHNACTLTEYMDCALNAHAPYNPGDVVYQKEKITHNALRWAIYDCDSVVVNVCCGLGDCMDIDYVDQSERGYIPRTQMPMKYARLWLQIASCTAVQVEGVWYYETIYSKTEKPIV